MPDEICIFDASPCLPAGAPCSLQDMGIMGSDHDDHCNEMGCVSPPCTDCVDGAIQEQCGGDSSSCPDGFSIDGCAPQGQGSDGALPACVMDQFQPYFESDDMVGAVQLLCSGELNVSSCNGEELHDIADAVAEHCVEQVGYETVCSDGVCQGMAPVQAMQNTAEQSMVTGEMDLDSSDLELMHDDDDEQLVAIVFPNVMINAGANVTQAVIYFAIDEVNEVSSQDVTISIFGELSPNPQQPSENNYDLSNRAPTTTSVPRRPR